MMETRHSPVKLAAFIALRDAGLSPAEIMEGLHIKRSQYYALAAEVRRVETEAKANKNADPLR